MPYPNLNKSLSEFVTNFNIEISDFLRLRGVADLCMQYSSSAVPTSMPVFVVDQSGQISFIWDADEDGVQLILELIPGKFNTILRRKNQTIIKEVNDPKEKVAEFIRYINSK